MAIDLCSALPATLLSIQVGRRTDYGDTSAADPLDRPWTTGFFKSPVAGSVQLTREGVAGDGQADRVHHGGIDKAVLCYSAVNLAQWAAEWGVSPLEPGGFGENLTVAGLDEANVCIGDRWRFGAVLLEVSQPRQPCWKLGRRWRRPELVKRVIETGRTGWYCRVIEPGELCGPAIGLLEARPHADWTIAHANAVFYRRRVDPTSAAELASLTSLALAWREELIAAT
jgi:MOSC domain-containing protein YiiM